MYVWGLILSLVLSFLLGGKKDLYMYEVCICTPRIHMGNTNINIDDELKQKAKEAMINISATAEKAIKDKLNIKELEIKDRCEFCGKEEPKAYMDNYNHIYHDGLTWLCPDEKWICSSCVKLKEAPYDNRNFD